MTQPTDDAGFHTFIEDTTIRFSRDRAGSIDILQDTTIPQDPDDRCDIIHICGDNVAAFIAALQHLTNQPS